MANIAAFFCGMMLAQVERDNERRARRHLLVEASEEESPFSLSTNILNDKLYARLQQKDSSLTELLITQDFFTHHQSISHGGWTRARGKLESLVKRDKWYNVKKALLRHCSLKRLEIHSVSLENDMFLSCIVDKMPQLTHLTLCDNEMGNTGACFLSKSLTTTKTTLLTSLTLQSQGISDKGAVCLATALSHTGITSLSLDRNFIHNAGACALAQILTQYNTSLQRLTISHNVISARGAMALAQALQHNKTLEELNLAANDNEMILQCIGNAGAKAFGEALQKNTTLRVLNLSNNHIGPSGCKALAQGLAFNSCLQELYLDNNSIGMEGFVALCHALETNTSLKILSLQDTMVPVEVSVQQALLRALEVNTTIVQIKSRVVNDQCAVWLELNRGLRPILQRDNQVPTGIWPMVFERASRDASQYMRVNLIYYAIQQKSDLFRL